MEVDVRVAVDPATRKLLETERRALLMRVRSIEEYLGTDKVTVSVSREEARRRGSNRQARI